MLLSFLFQILEEGFFVAILIFFSSVANPLTATISSTMILFIGHLLNSVLQNGKAIGGFTYFLIRAAYYLLPNLEKFNLRNMAVHQIVVSPETFFLTIGYALLYSILLLYAATLLLNRREL